MKDRPLDAEEMSEVQAFENDGFELVGMSASGSSPDQVQGAILRKVESIREDSDQIDPETLNELTLTLACLWGQIICRELSWELLKAGNLPPAEEKAYSVLG